MYTAPPDLMQDIREIVRELDKYNVLYIPMPARSVKEWIEMRQELEERCRGELERLKPNLTRVK